MKYVALIRHPGGILRMHKARLRGGVFKTRVQGVKREFSWDSKKTILYEKRGFIGFKIRRLSMYDVDVVPIDPPFGKPSVLPNTDQTRALRHLAEYAESRALEALGKPPAEMLYVLVFMLAAALGTGALVYFAMRGQR